MSNLRVSSHTEGGNDFDFVGTITAVHTEVGEFPGSGVKTTQLRVTIANDDHPEKARKFPETWSIGKPLVVLPSNDGINPVGEGEFGVSLCDARDNSRDPLISNKSVYSQIATAMITAGAPEDELPTETRTTDPKKNFQALVGLKFHWTLGETKKIEGTAKRLIPVKYLGRNTGTTSAPVNGTAAAAAPAIDVKATLAGLILDAVSASNPLPAAKLTLAIVPKLTGEYAGIKADAVKLMVQESFKKELEGLVGVKYSGKEFSL